MYLFPGTFRYLDDGSLHAGSCFVLRVDVCESLVAAAATIPKKRPKMFHFACLGPFFRVL